jgi:hypothetical protein
MRSPRAILRLLPIALSGLLAVGLGGCFSQELVLPFGAQSAGGGGKVQKLKTSAPVSGSITFLPGTVIIHGPGGQQTIASETNKGTFSATLPKRIALRKPKASAAGGGIKTVSGSFIQLGGGTFTPSTQSGSFTGTLLLRFDQAKLGLACLNLSANVTDNGRNQSGTFTLVGGTKIAASVRFSGTWTQALQSTGASTTSFTGNITGQGTYPKSARPLNADCKSLQPQL